MYNPDIHHRRSIRLREFDYSNTGAYFITLCLQHRDLLFGKCEHGSIELNEFGNIAKNIWVSLKERFNKIELDEFVIMPNHIHGIIVIKNDNVSGNNVGAMNVGAIHELPLQNKIERRNMLLPKIIGYYKMNSAKRINEIRKTRGTHVWQKNYFERVIRNENELIKIREYIITNPLRWEIDNEKIDANGNY
ncbi:MAG: transposase [Ignavibacteria bacterium]|nr:transposase [Ignavibacteria bacterium]